MSENLRDELVSLTSDLIRFESIAERPDQLAAAIHYVAGYLATIPNIHVQRSERNSKPALVATLRETRRPALLLNAHLDVVVAAPQQFQPEVRDGRIYGRASQDMKGSAAVMLCLLRDLAALEHPPDVGFQFVSDEEIGGRDGTGRLLEDGWRCETFIALEPTDMHICYAQKAPMWVEVTVPGTPGHGSRPWDSRNPIFAIQAGLARLAERFPAPDAPIWRTTVTPTSMQAGGGSRNQIPASAGMSFDIRHTGEDRPEDLVALLQECFPGAEVRGGRSGGLLESDPNEAAFQRLAHISRQVTGRQCEFYREHFASDARFYSQAGIPAICFGPVGQGLHSDDEWVSVDGLVDLYNVLREYVQ
jgi:succinyl-diaminopimelate desuccinylase